MNRCINKLCNKAIDHAAAEFCPYCGAKLTPSLSRDDSLQNLSDAGPIPPPRFMGRTKEELPETHTSEAGQIINKKKIITPADNSISDNNRSHVRWAGLAIMLGVITVIGIITRPANELDPKGEEDDALPLHHYKRVLDNREWRSIEPNDLTVIYPSPGRRSRLTWISKENASEVGKTCDDVAISFRAAPFSEEELESCLLVKDMDVLHQTFATIVTKDKVPYYTLGQLLEGSLSVSHNPSELKPATAQMTTTTWVGRQATFEIDATFTEDVGGTCRKLREAYGVYGGTADYNFCSFMFSDKYNKKICRIVVKDFSSPSSSVRRPPDQKQTGTPSDPPVSPYVWQGAALDACFRYSNN